MEFQIYKIADVSTAHITQADAEILAQPTTPGRVAALDNVEEDGSPGMILSVPMDAACGKDRADEYRRLGLSAAFIGLMDDLTAQGIPYVRFDRDGARVIGAPEFVW